MKFIVDNDGAPDIPERLLQNHEEGKVIFFCGAGISYDAGLPGFMDLVVKIYENLGCTYNQFQEEAIKNGQLDLAITLLEKDNIYTKSKIKDEINKILSSPKLDHKSIIIHKALLKLSKTKDNKLRLVTTNFDGIFESLQVNKEFYSYIAPALPIINSDWDGLIYLHGLLNEENTNPIVISSGDFGQAYLIDRWAARFMGQLLKNYSVCFVGYSLNDPLLRYMTDAIAAGKNNGETATEIFAFCDYDKRGKYTKKEYIIEKWKSKGVIPIPYNKKNNHSLLKKTLSAWADSYSKGFQGKVQEVLKLSELRPSLNTAENDNVKKMIWALSDSTGKAAEAFANNNPLFDLSWLYVLSETKYKGKDLSLFGIFSQDLDEEYSIMNRPVAERNKRSIHSIVSNVYEYDYRDNIFEGIYNWLLRHINNPDLIIWICKNGGLLNINFKIKIINKLNKFDEWEINNNEGNKLEKENYLLDNPNGIPTQEMRILWDLVLSDRFCSHRNSKYQYYSNNFKRNGINNSNKKLLIDALTPFITIKKSSNNNFFSFKNYEKEDEENSSIFSTLDLNVEIDINVSHFLSTMENIIIWKMSLNNCILDFTLLLKEYCDLNFKLGKKIFDDYSYIYIADISNIDINHIHHHNSYATLLYLLWNSWASTNTENPNYADDILKIWWNEPYPIFRRLTYLALSKKSNLDFEFAYYCLKDDNCKWLWAQNTRYETFQLLKKIAKNCEVNSIKLIEDLLMSGEACDIYSHIEKKDKLDEIFSKNLYARLDTIKRVNPKCLSKIALKKYNEIKEKYSLSTFDNKSFEKPFNLISSYEDQFERVQLPKGYKDLYEHIKNNQQRDYYHTRDDWKDLCINDSILVCNVLINLYKAEIDSIAWWNDAFNNWRDESIVNKSWNSLANEIVIFNDEFIIKCASNMSDWLNNLSFVEFNNEDQFLELINLIIIKYTDKNEVNDDYFSAAINNPIGICMDTLQKWWISKKPTNYSLIDEKLISLYTDVCKNNNPKFISGKVIFASNILFFYQVDSSWTKENLIPLFDWENDETVANAVWQGYLWNPRSNINLINDIKKYLIQTSNHKEKLYSYKDQYIRLISSIGVYNKDLIKKESLQKIFSCFDEEELIIIIDYLTNLIKNTEENIEIIWNEKLYPFIKNCFPKSKSIIAKDLSESFGFLCINSGDVFDKVYDVMNYYLIPIEWPDTVLSKFDNNMLLEKFPKKSLLFIRKLIDKNSKVSTYYLKDCLDKIIKNDSALCNLIEYKELIERT